MEEDPYKWPAQALTEDDWKPYKVMMQQLYFRMNLKKVMLHMKKEEAFVASKNQYERKFKEWKFRKNVKANEWDHVLNKTRKRDEDNKETQVELEGFEISRKRIKKEQSRGALSRIPCDYSDPSTPEGLTIGTPPSVHLDAPFRKIQFDNLPCFTMQQILGSLPASVLSLSPEYGSTFSLMDSLSGGHAVPRMLSTTPDPFMQAGAIYQVCNSPRFAMIPAAFEREVIQQQLLSTTLERWDGEHDTRIATLFDSSKIDALRQVVMFVVQFASNNMLSRSQEMQMLTWISQQDDILLENLFAMQNLAVDACIESLVSVLYTSTEQARLGREKLFRALLKANKRHPVFHRGSNEQLLYRAVELSLPDIVSDFISQNLDINAEVRCRVDRNELRTFLGAATDVHIAKLLLEAGADVDAPSQDFLTDAANGPIDEDFRAPVYVATSGADPELFQLLIDYGARYEPIIPNTDRDIIINLPHVKSVSINMLELLLKIETEKPPSYENVALSYGIRYHSPGRNDLAFACHKGRAEMVEAILSTVGGKKNLQTGHCGWELLRYAAIEGDLRIVELLIAAGVDVNATGQYIGNDGKRKVYLTPSTALMAAVKRGHIEVVKFLLSKGADVNVVAVGTTALEVAEKIGNSALVTLLKLEGARSRKLIPQSYNEFQLATLRRDLPQLSRIIGSSAMDMIYNLIMPPPSALEIAIRLSDDMFIWNSCIEGADCNLTDIFGTSLLQKALWESRDPCGCPRQFHRTRSFEVISTLLRFGARVDAPAGYDCYGQLVNTPLELAVEWYDHRTIELLLSYTQSAVTSLAKGSILNLAASNTALGVSSIQILIDRGADVQWVNSLSQNPIHSLFRRKSADMDILRLLLRYGMNINARDAHDRQALHFFFYCSGRKDDIDKLQMMLNYGADVDSRTLQCAIETGQNIELINMILDKGAEINASPGWCGGVTALQTAAMCGHLRIAHMLLQRGADPNAPGSEVRGRTALEGAAENGRLDMVQLLLNAGAEPSQSAVDFAEGEGHRVIVGKIRAALEMEESDEMIERRMNGNERFSAAL